MLIFRRMDTDISRLRGRLLLVALGGLLLFSTGCKQLTEAPKDAEKLDASVHAAMGRGDWKSIYADADPEMRSSTTEEKFGTLFTAIDKKLGKPVSTTQTGWKINAETSGTLLISQCETKFEKDASGTETFTWRKTDGQYRLYGYHINSDELISR